VFVGLFVSMQVTHIVATHLENLEKSGNLRMIKEKFRENRKSQGKFRENVFLHARNLANWFPRKSLKLLPPDVRFLWLKCTKFDFGWDSAPEPAGGAYTGPKDT